MTENDRALMIGLWIFNQGLLYADSLRIICCILMIYNKLFKYFVRIRV